VIHPLQAACQRQPIVFKMFYRRRKVSADCPDVSARTVSSAFAVTLATSRHHSVECVAPNHASASRGLQTYVRHCRRDCESRCGTGVDRRAETAGIPRLRFGRASPSSIAAPTAMTCGACAAPAVLQKWNRRRPPIGVHRQPRHRPHALGHARRRHRIQRASAYQRRRRAGAQRHHREPRAAARTPARARLRVRVADRHRSHRASSSITI
jgi:hypothetical protein